MSLYLAIGIFAMHAALVFDLVSRQVKQPVTYLIGAIFWPVIAVSCAMQVFTPDAHDRLIEAIKWRRW